MNKVTLYSYKDSPIKISIKAFFDEKNCLIIEGYDIGKRVKELLGDSDYEYFYTVKPREAVKFYKLFELEKMIGEIF